MVQVRNKKAARASQNVEALRNAAEGQNWIGKDFGGMSRAIQAHRSTAKNRAIEDESWNSSGKFAAQASEETNP